MQPIETSYNYLIVIISISIAISASYLSLDLVRRVNDSLGKVRNRGLIFSSFIMGIGIWSMHFTGMLALNINTPLRFNLLLTLISFLVAVCSALIAFYFSTYLRLRRWTLPIGSLFMGVGVASMHFIGMYAMDMKVVMTYNHSFLVLSIIISFLASYVSLFLLFKYKNKGHSTILSFPSALVMGGAISSMHYVAMAAITFYSTPTINNHGLKLFDVSLHRDTLWMVITILVYFILIFTGLISAFEKKNLIEELEYKVHYDGLTGLPNRNKMNEILGNLIDRNELHPKKIAVLYLDITRFNLVNETMGMDSGDQLLVRVSERFKENLESGDLLSRLSGIHFSIIKEYKDETQIIHLSEQLVKEFMKPFTLHGELIFLGVKIGISLFPLHGTTVQELKRRADQALFRAKERGHNHFFIFKEEPEDIMLRRMHLETALYKAMENKEFELHYQAQVNLKEYKIVGMEALLRWNHPKWGMISPAEFIPLAEETGLIIPIGNWVLREACEHYKDWQRNGLKSFPISINVSVKQFENTYFVEEIKQIIKETEFNPKFLHLEITESIMQDHYKSVRIFEELKALGIKISIDDFGTGYSSLSVLKNLHVDIIKIDQSFVRDMTLNAGTASIVKSILQMSDSLGLKVVAEGIENHRQVDFLIEENCMIGQGFLFSKPLPQKQVIEFLSAPHFQSNIMERVVETL